jgi:hypothetical protein
MADAPLLGWTFRRVRHQVRRISPGGGDGQPQAEEMVWAETEDWTIDDPQAWHAIYVPSPPQRVRIKLANATQREEVPVPRGLGRWIRLRGREVSVPAALWARLEVRLGPGETTIMEVDWAERDPNGVPAEAYAELTGRVLLE